MSWIRSAILVSSVFARAIGIRQMASLPEMNQSCIGGASYPRRWRKDWNNTAFVLGGMGKYGVMPGLRKCIALAETIGRVGGWLGKVYIMTDTLPTYTESKQWKKGNPKIEFVQIEPIRDGVDYREYSAGGGGGYLKTQMFDHPSIHEDVLIWHDCDKMVGQPDCITGMMGSAPLEFGPDQVLLLGDMPQPVPCKDKSQKPNTSVNGVFCPYDDCKKGWGRFKDRCGDGVHVGVFAAHRKWSRPLLEEWRAQQHKEPDTYDRYTFYDAWKKIDVKVRRLPNAYMDHMYSAKEVKCMNHMSGPRVWAEENRGFLETFLSSMCLKSMTYEDIYEVYANMIKWARSKNGTDEVIFKPRYQPLSTASSYTSENVNHVEQESRQSPSSNDLQQGSPKSKPSQQIESSSAAKPALQESRHSASSNTSQQGSLKSRQSQQPEISSARHPDPLESRQSASSDYSHQENSKNTRPQHLEISSEPHPAPPESRHSASSGTSQQESPKNKLSQQPESGSAPHPAPQESRHSASSATSQQENSKNMRSQHPEISGAPHPAPPEARQSASSDTSQQASPKKTPSQQPEISSAPHPGPQESQHSESRHTSQQATPKNKLSQEPESSSGPHPAPPESRHSASSDTSQQQISRSTRSQQPEISSAPQPAPQPCLQEDQEVQQLVIRNSSQQEDQTEQGVHQLVRDSSSQQEDHVEEGLQQLVPGNNSQHESHTQQGVQQLVSGSISQQEVHAEQVSRQLESSGTSQPENHSEQGAQQLVTGSASQQEDQIWKRSQPLASGNASQSANITEQGLQQLVSGNTSQQ